MGNIRIIGCGGAGIKTLNYLKVEGVPGAVFTALDFDKEAISKSNADFKLTLPSDISDEAVSEKLDLHGDDIVFIIAGLGENAGGRFANIAARCAKNNACCYAFMPYAFEGTARVKRAEEEYLRLVESGIDVEKIDNNRILKQADRKMEIGQLYQGISDYIHKSILKTIISKIA